ncbi:MAG: hypothetical protein AAF322_12090, partial [Pseudomonadota bacterium]
EVCRPAARRREGLHPRRGLRRPIRRRRLRRGGRSRDRPAARYRRDGSWAGRFRRGPARAPPADPSAPIASADVERILERIARGWSPGQDGAAETPRVARMGVGAMNKGAMQGFDAPIRRSAPPRGGFEAKISDFVRLHLPPLADRAFPASFAWTPALAPPSGLVECPPYVLESTCPVGSARLIFGFSAAMARAFKRLIEPGAAA